MDSLRIRLKSPQKLEITVVEKGILGYLYVPSLGKNAYFGPENDGILGWRIFFPENNFRE